MTAQKFSGKAHSKTKHDRIDVNRSIDQVPKVTVIDNEVLIDLVIYLMLCCRMSDVDMRGI